MFFLPLFISTACISFETEPSAEPIISDPSIIPVQKQIFWEEKYLESTAFLTPEIIVLLQSNQWNTVITKLEPLQLNIQQNQERNILLAWASIHSKNPEKSIAYLGDVLAFEGLPSDYKSFLLGKIYQLNQKSDEAIQYFEKVPNDSLLYSRTLWALLDLADKNADPIKESEILLKLDTLQHPFEKGDSVLLRLAKEKGLKNKEAYPFLRKLWQFYPKYESTLNTQSDLEQLQKIGVSYQATHAELSNRMTALMALSLWKTVIAELKPLMTTLKPTDAASCELIYAYGRSHFKLNEVTDASNILKPVGENCAGKQDDVGAKAWYLRGKSLERKKMWKDAGNSFAEIPKRYPAHSMADDGYALAGIGYQEAGDTEKAMLMWSQQVAEFPEGDLIGEGYWRLAWNSYLSGETQKAIEWTLKAQQVVPPTDQPYQYFAFPYWEARWRVYPDREQPSVQNTDPAEVSKGIEQWKNLVQHYPTEFYALLAANRLYELAPEWMNTLQVTPAPILEKKGWWIDEDLANQSAVIHSTQLAHLGLYQDAVEIFASIADTNESTKAIYSHLYQNINWYVAHDLMHKYIQNHPPHTWTENHAQIFAQTYPNTHFETLSQIAKDREYQYDVRIFHALVREESSFNPEIVSWAGAKGLSQLMPATAERVGEWVGISVNRNNIFDPTTNLTIGSRYLDYLREFFKGNMFLAVPGYNAGEGNIKKWLASKGNLPTDEFVESIPLRETRHYVKRVLGTYQAYHYLYDGSPTFYDFSAFNHQAQP